MRLSTLLSHTVQMPNGCIEWTGARDKDGYGRYSGKLAHREAFRLAFGDIPSGMLVCHTCDNPPCVNPDHLWSGTVKANCVDSSQKRRAGNQYGGQAATHCVNGHEYTPENTYWRPRRTAARDCRICIRERVARYVARKAAA